MRTMLEQFESDDLEMLEEDESDDEDYGDPCYHCGPGCEHWMGDDLCEFVIDQQAKEADEYHTNYVKENYYCPKCGKELTLYQIPTDQLWQWPGDFYNPMIALDIYAIYGAPKGLIHSVGNIHHVFVGDGKFRDEKLIELKINLKKEHKP